MLLPSESISVHRTGCLHGSVHIIANDYGNISTPSYVAFIDDGRWLVGEEAKNQASANPTNTMHAMTRLIGRKFHATDEGVGLGKIHREQAASFTHRSGFPMLC